VKIAPSILAANFYNLENQLITLKESNIDYLHFDVMDGNFVDNISFGAPVLKSLSKEIEFIYDVHLMIADPIKYVNQFAEAGANIITFHYEATKSKTIKTIEKIKKNNCKVGISINPNTKVEKIYKFLKYVDLVLVMSVHPGRGGQSFIEDAYSKIEKLSKYKKENGLDFIISVDGGVNDKNIKKIEESGANLAVAGSSVFKNGEIVNNLTKLN